MPKSIMAILGLMDLVLDCEWFLLSVHSQQGSIIPQGFLKLGSYTANYNYFWASKLGWTGVQYRAQKLQLSGTGLT